MAHANDSIITGKFKGSLGKQLVCRQWEGKTIVAKSPKARVGDPTTPQEEIQKKFLAGSSARANFQSSIKTGVQTRFALHFLRLRLLLITRSDVALSTKNSGSVLA
jgi:hypothetical protein